MNQAALDGARNFPTPHACHFIPLQRRFFALSLGRAALPAIDEFPVFRVSRPRSTGGRCDSDGGELFLIGGGALEFCFGVAEAFEDLKVTGIR